MITSFVRNVVIGFALCTLAAAVAAQSYPSRPVKVVVPYGPGTAIDVIMRELAELLSKSLGQPFVVENRPGASGTIGGAYVASSPPDGYTILSESSSHTSAPAFLPKLSFDPKRDLAGVTTVIDSPLVLVVAKSSGIKSLGELIAAAKANPGALTFASAGLGSSTYMTAEKMRAAAGFDALHVPFKSTTDGLTEVVAGRVTYTYTGVASAVPLVKDGRLVPLALGFHRSGAFPDVPTSEEAGVPNSGYSGWLGLLVPAKTPRDIVNRLHQETVKAMASPQMKERLSKAGAEAYTMTPEEFDALREREFVENERMVRSMGIKPP
jgi:tripartite-type tricarboxylate transporter receptor subunit TctC